jgi:hypothetical protein
MPYLTSDKKTKRMKNETRKRRWKEEVKNHLLQVMLLPDWSKKDHRLPHSFSTSRLVAREIAVSLQNTTEIMIARAL